jgi:hypothetical protein
MPCPTTADASSTTAAAPCTPSEIAGVAAGRAKIMVDGSFCRGTDIARDVLARISSASVACNPRRSPQQVKPESCGCLNCSKTK